jgi:hypothetical protein
MRTRFFALIFFYIFVSGCTREVSDVITEWEEKGWSKVRTHGTQKTHQRHSTLKSDQAQAVEVSWIENGKRKTKLYRQDSHYYLAIRFFCGDKDKFAVVMRKRK